MPCPTCDRFPVRTRRFEELAVSVERHATLYKCQDCGQLIELVGEERSVKTPSLIDSFYSYFESSCFPISVPALSCKSCGERIDLLTAIFDAPYSWTNLSSFWHECQNCNTGSHIQIKKNTASIIEIIGAPGPDWRVLSTARVKDLDCRTDPDFLQIWFEDKHRAIPIRK